MPTPMRNEWIVTLVWPLTGMGDWDRGNAIVNEVEDEMKLFERDDFDGGGSGTGFGMRDVDWHFLSEEGAQALHDALLIKFTSEWIEMVKKEEFCVSFFQKEVEVEDAHAN